MQGREEQNRNHQRDVYLVEEFKVVATNEFERYGDGDGPTQGSEQAKDVVGHKQLTPQCRQQWLRLV
jgi:hypothetical protein